MTLRERQIEYEKMNSFVPGPSKPVTVYVDKDKNRINVDLSKGQVKQNKLRVI